MGTQFFSEMGAMLRISNSLPKVDERTVIITQVRGVSELTTTVFMMETVVPVSQDAVLGDKFLVGTTKLLYIAHGEVRAGFDLSNLTTADVVIEGETLMIHLPPPQILDRKIDVNRSTVYDYNRGFLGLGPDTALELQTLAQRNSLNRIVEAACQNGVLEKANERAELVLTRLINVSGYKEVKIKTQPPTSCS